MVDVSLGSHLIFVATVVISECSHNIQKIYSRGHRGADPKPWLSRVTLLAFQIQYSLQQLAQGMEGERPHALAGKKQIAPKFIFIQQEREKHLNA